MLISTWSPTTVALGGRDSTCVASWVYRSAEQGVRIQPVLLCRRLPAQRSKALSCEEQVETARRVWERKSYADVSLDRVNRFSIYALHLTTNVIISFMMIIIMCPIKLTYPLVSPQFSDPPKWDVMAYSVANPVVHRHAGKPINPGKHVMASRISERWAHWSLDEEHAAFAHELVIHPFVLLPWNANGYCQYYIILYI